MSLDLSCHKNRRRAVFLYAKINVKGDTEDEYY